MCDMHLSPSQELFLDVSVPYPASLDEPLVDPKCGRVALLSSEGANSLTRIGFLCVSLDFQHVLKPEKRLDV